MLHSTKALFGTFLAIIALPLLIAAPAPGPSVDELFATLQKSLPPSAAGENAQLGLYLARLKQSWQQGRYADVQQMLPSLRAMPFGATEPAASLLDQLALAVDNQIAAATAARETAAAKANAARDAALDEIIADVTKKFSAHAPAADFDAVLKQLSTLMTASGQQYNEPVAQKLRVVQSFVTRWQDYLVMSAQGNNEQALGAIRELVQLSSQATVIPRSQLIALQAEVAKHASTQADASAVRFEALKKSVAAAVDSAKSAADFDAVLAELAKPVESNNGGFGYNGNGNNNNQIEYLRRFTHRWQDYFSQLEAGNGTAAQNVLRELSNDNSTENFYPRSRILARLNGRAASPAKTATTPEPLVTPDALTLDTLDKLVRQLGERRAEQNSEPGTEDLLTEAGRLRAAANQLALGNPQPVMSLTRLQNSSARTGAYALPLARIQQGLVIRSLPAFLDAPADLKPAANESAESFLKRVVQRGAASKDWRLVYRALDAGQNLSQATLGGVNVSSDLNGYRQFFIGLNQEKAGQWAPAVRSYLGALRTDAPNLPLEEIGQHLEQIKSAHPKDYEMAESVPYPEAYAWPGGATVPGRYPVGVMSAAQAQAAAMAEANARRSGINPALNPATAANALPVPPAPEPAAPAPTRPPKP